ncbi:hypothetical protein [Olivibacter sitiensis]|uniref:hypothetical protein n=1 Tax=Olivibacter sitiensis TaxID=376470 RepID=UPI000408B2A6|nr:hypothetical protein [Olivibacter sitiensis]
MCSKTVFKKIFVLPFYQAHVGMFLFAALLLFGLVDPSQLLPLHISLSVMLCSNWWAAIGLLVFWGLYLLKAVTFIKKKMREKNSAFLYYSAYCLSSRTRIALWSYVLLYISLPLGGYILLCMITAVAYGYIAQPLCIVFASTLAFFSTVKYVDRSFTNQRNSGNRHFEIILLQKMDNSHLFLGIRHLVDQQKIAFLTSKVLSYFLVVGMFHAFSDVQDNIRMATLVMVLLALANSMVLFGQYRFEQYELAFMRNLPFGSVKRWLLIPGRITIILLPEITWLYIRYDVVQASLLVIFLLCASLLVYHFAILSDNETDAYIKLLAYFFLSMIFVVPFGYITVVSLIFLVTSLVIYSFKRRFG